MKEFNDFKNLLSTFSKEEATKYHSNDLEVVKNAIDNIIVSENIITGSIFIAEYTLSKVKKYGEIYSIIDKGFINMLAAYNNQVLPQEKIDFYKDEYLVKLSKRQENLLIEHIILTFDKMQIGEHLPFQ